MKILVTGSSGFVGKALVRELLAEGHELVLAQRTNISTNDINISWAPLDLHKTQEWHSILQKCQVVIHLAARVHKSDKDTESSTIAYREANVIATENLARQAAQSKIKRFIFLSSVKAMGEESLVDHPFSESDECRPSDAYGVSKLSAEQVLLAIANETEMEVVIIRPPLVYGNGVKANFSKLIGLVRLGVPLPLGNIHNLRSFIYLGNLVDFIKLTINHPNAKNQIFLVSDDDDVSTTTLVKKIYKLLKKPILLIPIPTTFLKIFFGAFQSSSILHKLCGNLQVDITKAKTLLEWKPPFTLDQGIQKTIQEK